MLSQDFTIGRCGLATAAGGDGLELKCSSFEQSGDECKASGVIRGQSSVEDVNALRQQLNGYDLNTDEPVVPVTWVQDPSIDGFYRVQSVAVSAEVTGRQKSNADGGELAYRWDVDLLRVAGWQSPLFEIITSGNVRVNSHSVTDADAVGYVGYPATATSDRFVEASASPGVSTRYGASGNDIFVSTATVVSTTPLGNTLVYAVPAADYFDCACVISAGSRVASATAPDVSAFRTVVGRQVDASGTEVMISNDLIRVLYGPSTGQLVIGQWEDSSATGAGADEWTYKTYKLTTSGATATSLGDPTSVTILRNSPECASVRFWYDAGTQAARTADVTLRRGQSWTEILIADPNSLGTAAHGVFRYAVEAGTTAGVTGGVNANADDADLNKYRIRCAKAVTADTTNGGIYLTSAANSAMFGVDTDFAFSATAFDVTAGFWAAVNHRQKVTAR